MKSANRRFLSLLIVLILALGLLPVQALAVEAIDPAKDVTITLKYVYDGNAISGAEFGIYRIASVSADGEFALTGDFKNYPVRLDGLDTAGWNVLAQTLYGYAQRDNLQQLDRGVTDGNGRLTFPTDNVSLKPGLYLISGKTVTIEGYSYSAAPFIVGVPVENAEANAWIYDVIVNPKTDRKEFHDHDTVTRKVLKIWDDKEHESERPSEIVIQLLRDGEVYETVTLNKDNNWRYTWDNLEEQYEWVAVEKELTGYTVKTERDGVTYVITNTYSPDTPSGDTVSRKVHKVWDDKGYENRRPQYVTVTLLKDGVEYDTQRISAAGNWEYRWEELPRYDKNGNEIKWSIREGAVPGYVANVTYNGENFVLTNSVDKQRLPQTGVLWWPVPIMAVAGLAFLLIGEIIRKREDEDNE